MKEYMKLNTVMYSVLYCIICNSIPVYSMMERFKEYKSNFPVHNTLVLEGDSSCEDSSGEMEENIILPYVYQPIKTTHYFCSRIVLYYCQKQKAINCYDSLKPLYWLFCN